MSDKLPLTVEVDASAPRGNVLEPLARLLRKLRDRQRTDTAPRQPTVSEDV
jgi:hypothetical protein